MNMQRLFRVTGLAGALLGLAITMAVPVPAAAEPITVNETRILHVVRINCDDEAAHFSDEINFWVNGNWQGSKTNMDGGDWWDINRSYQFEDSIHVEIKEWAGWSIGSSTITVAEAGLGLLVRTYVGHQGTNYRYRLTYWVE